jgi:hypothetical protein
MPAPKKPINAAKLVSPAAAAAPAKSAEPVSAPATPVAQKTANLAPAPVESKPVDVKPAPVIAKAESAKREAPPLDVPKAETSKSARKATAPVKPAPAPVAADVVAPAKPVEAAKVAPAKPVAPKVAEAMSAPTVPVIDLIKPVTALQENVRANTEKVITGMRSHYAEVKGMAETATIRLEDSMKAAQVGSRAFGFKLFEIAKAQTHDHIDHAKRLAAAKTLPEVISTQQNFILAQVRAAQERSKDVAVLAGEIVQNVANPLRASLEALTRR